ncbi:MAG: hypothetical protein ACRDXB_05320, partial [Actinomycetes bacterium]
MIWEQAGAAADDLRQRAIAVGDPEREAWRSSRPPDARVLTLLVYAAAGEHNCAPDDVEEAWLRYRVEDPAGLLTWLCAQLQRMGHKVAAPMRRGPVPIPRAEVDPQVALAAALQKMIADDLIVRAWTRTTLITADQHETSDGLRITSPPTCELLDQRRGLCRLLDALLLERRHGHPLGSPVAATGVPPYTSEVGQMAADVGVHPYRAVVHAPRWDLDHVARTIVAGPPRGYELAYRHANTGEPLTYAVAVVPASHLQSDLAPWPDPAGDLARLTDAALSLVERPTVGPSAEPDRTDHDRDSASAFQGSAEEDLTAAHAADHLLETLQRSGHELPEDPWQRYRATALAMLWRLRDRELVRVGDSTPWRVAERIM